MPALTRSYVAGNFALDLNGVHAGWIKSLDGGGISADVIVENIGSAALGGFLKKHIGQPKYDDFSIKVSFTSGKTLFDWIADSWAGKFTRKNGAVHSCDYNFNIIDSREFRDALITEVSFPALDAASRDAGYLTIKITPEEVIRRKAAGSVKPPSGKAGQKSWLPANFTFDLSGLATKTVSKIDAFSVKQSVVEGQLGEARDSQKEPGKLEFPNLKVYISKSESEPSYTWFDDFVIKGNNGDGNEKNGSITILSNDLRTVLATIKLYNVGIFRLADEPIDANSERIARAIAELYVERMEFVVAKI